MVTHCGTGIGNGEELDDSRGVTGRNATKVQKWCTGAGVNCSGCEQRQPERLGPRRWIVECGWRSVMKTRQNGVTDESHICHLTQFIDEVRRCRPVKAFIHKDGTLESNPLWSPKPVELAKERSDVVEPRRRKDRGEQQSSSLTGAVTEDDGMPATAALS